MPNIFYDRIKETSTTTGTGTIVLAGAVSQFQTFTSRFAVGEQIFYVIANQSGTQWEVGRGELTDSTHLQRNFVLESSASDALVSFSGTNDVFCTFPENRANRLFTKGRDLAGYMGAFWP